MLVASSSSPDAANAKSDYPGQLTLIGSGAVIGMDTSRRVHAREAGRNRRQHAYQHACSRRCCSQSLHSFIFGVYTAVYCNPNIYPSNLSKSQQLLHPLARPMPGLNSPRSDTALCWACVNVRMVPGVYLRCPREDMNRNFLDNRTKSRVPWGE